MMYPGPPLPPHPTAGQKQAHQLAFRRWCEAEAARIRRQRVHLTRRRPHFGLALVKAMLDRAWELLDSGEAEAADALLEFVPAEEAEKLLNEFFEEG